MTQGKFTGEFGKKLTEELKLHAHTSKYQVYYDHGNKSIEKNVCAIKGLYRNDITEEVSNLNRLADVDIIIADEKDKILALIEIEERGISPKRILGDIFSILFCNSFSIKIEKNSKYFKITPNTVLLIYGILPGNGKRLIKVKKTIEPRISKFQNPKDSISTKNIELGFSDEIDKTIKLLGARIKKLLRIKTNTTYI